MAKQYGLILPASKLAPKAKPIFVPSKNVFGDESDSDENELSTSQIAPLRPSDNTKRQARIVQAKALAQDPTVYQYDELYDDMSSKKSEEKKLAKAEKKPRYIEKLIESSNKRKRENERRLERQVQKEREAEGNQFSDKEAFVTSAYKKKLEELRLEEEKEKREEYLEQIGDVTKQKDLDGFYRHLYEQKLQPEKYSERLQKQVSGNDVQQVVVKNEEIGLDSNDGNESDHDPPKHGRKRKSEGGEDDKQTKVQRSYRKRQSSGDNNKDIAADGDDESDKDEINRITVEDLKAGNRPLVHLQSNLDADSDFSTGSSSSSEDEEETKPDTLEQIKPETAESVEDTKKPEVSEESFKVPDEVKLQVIPKVSEVNTEKAVEEKPKIDIWKKRTVGVIFDEALKRYYERKASRCR